MRETQRWETLAACQGHDPELFFPGAWDADQRERAREVCRGCPVRAQCLREALALTEREKGNTSGIWGGTTERERLAMLELPIHDEPRRACTHCGEGINPGEIGRPRRYCSDKCQQAAHRQRERDRTARRKFGRAAA